MPAGSSAGAARDVAPAVVGVEIGDLTMVHRVSRSTERGENFRPTMTPRVLDRPGLAGSPPPSVRRTLAAATSPLTITGRCGPDARNPPRPCRELEQQACYILNARFTEAVCIVSQRIAAGASGLLGVDHGAGRHGSSRCNTAPRLDGQASRSRSGAAGRGLDEQARRALDDRSQTTRGARSRCATRAPPRAGGAALRRSRGRCNCAWRTSGSSPAP